MQWKENKWYITAFLLMLIAAFIQCYRTVYDLHWAYEPDFDRDIAYIRNTLNGHYGQDPSMAGQYMWYNPLMFLFETAVVKMTGLPINIVVARAGAFINILSPVAFFVMVLKMFDNKIALASVLSFLFLASGNLPCWGAATYSPWLISDTFSQFLFYISILLCYKAFTEQKMVWFMVLGASLGITFLGHSAPAILVILIMISLQVQNVFKALKDKNFVSIKTYILQGVVTFIPFVIFAYPFLYYVYGKYHFHFLNHAILECAPGVFARKDTLALLKLNGTFSLIIAIIGLIWFYKNFTITIVRKIVFSWLFITLIMYVYESAVPTIARLYNIQLPDTIPAFHYFFYLKALQSILFGFGFICLAEWLYRWIQGLGKNKFKALSLNNFIVLSALLYAVVYFPIYSNRYDFSALRQQAIDKGNEKDKIAVYDFISKNVPLSSVLLCEHGLSLFPVMPTAIKMVSVETYFSNPYVSYDKREGDRNKMLSLLTKPNTATLSDAKLFYDYNVSVILLSNDDYKQYKTPAFANSTVIFKNDSYTILSFAIKPDAKVSFGNLIRI